MTTAISTIPQAIMATFSPEQRDLIKRTVAPDATNDELAMFLHVAAKSGLDPLQKQIWFVKRSGRVTIQAGIDGLQARAAREPDYEGMTYGVVCQKDDFQFDATTGAVTKHTYNPFGERGAILGAWCIVRRKALLPFTAMVRFSEYNQGGSPLWKDKPAVMIEKVARSTALRRAYPEALSGIYAPEEMGDKGHDITAPAVESQPIPSRAAEAKRLEAAPAVTVEAQVVEAPPAGEKPRLPPTGDALWTEWAHHCKSAGIGSAEGLTKWKETVANILGERAPSPGKWNEEQIGLMAVALIPSYSEDIPF